MPSIPTAQLMCCPSPKVGRTSISPIQLLLVQIVPQSQTRKGMGRGSSSTQLKIKIKTLVLESYGHLGTPLSASPKQSSRSPC